MNGLENWSNWFRVAFGDINPGNIITHSVIIEGSISLRILGDTISLHEEGI